MLRVVGRLDNLKRVLTEPAKEDSETVGFLCLPYMRADHGITLALTLVFWLVASEDA